MVCRKMGRLGLDHVKWHLAKLHLALQQIIQLSHGKTPPSSPTQARDVMEGATTSVERLLMDFLTPILPNIGWEPTIEGLIELHQLVSGNMASVLLNLVGGQHGHLAMKMTRD